MKLPHILPLTDGNTDKMMHSTYRVIVSSYKHFVFEYLRLECSFTKRKKTGWMKKGIKSKS